MRSAGCFRVRWGLSLVLLVCFAGLCLPGAVLGERVPLQPESRKAGDPPLSEKAAVRCPGSESRAPLSYELTFSMEVAGTMTLFSPTRFCRSEDIHMKLAAFPGPDGWVFESVRLDDSRDRMNFGIGEGPNKHQRYLLFTSEPTDRGLRQLEGRVREWEAARGYAVASDLIEKVRSDYPDKKAFFNRYMWENPEGSFRFLRDEYGKTVSVTDDTDITVLARKGGRLAKPRFFELLGNALLSVPAYSDSFKFLPDSDGTVRWETDCEPVLKGLSHLVKQVYGRKMNLVGGGRDLGDQKLTFQGHVVGESNILWAHAESGRLDSVPVRVSGLKGRIWIESLRREIYLDLSTRRIIKDDFEISFGIYRKSGILPVNCEKNVVRVSLVDECFSHCPGTDRGILLAQGQCLNRPEVQAPAGPGIPPRGAN